MKKEAIQVPTTEEELLKLVERYHNLEYDAKCLRAEIQNISSPNKPDAFANLRAMQDYAKHEVNACDAINSRYDKIREFNEQMDYLADVIADALPVNCVWVFVGNYMVAKYFDVHKKTGKNHSIEVIVRGSDKVPPLYDRTYS